MPGLFGLFFWLDIGYLGIGRKEMVQILIGLKFLNGDGLRRDQSGTVLHGSRIGQVVIIINNFLVFSSFISILPPVLCKNIKRLRLDCVEKEKGILYNISMSV